MKARTADLMEIREGLLRLPRMPAALISLVVSAGTVGTRLDTLVD
jgi:hypothetical protein